MNNHSDSLNVFGVDIDTPDMAMAASTIALFGQTRSRQPVRVSFVNADCLNKAWQDYEYKRALDTADLVLPDGTGVRMAARWLGRAAPENVNGTDLFPHLCAASASGAPNAPTLYFLGGAPGVAERCAERMRECWPGIRIVGAEHGYFTPEEEEAVIERINAANPGILLVGMGAPRQDTWTRRVSSRLRAGVVLGVGGLFDFYSGDIPRAPAWMRRCGSEWVWRLMMEPRRMAGRYLVGNPLFLIRLVRHIREMRSDAGKTRHTGFRIMERCRRFMDIATAGTALVLLAPLLLLAAAALRLESEGSVIFSQTRVGQNGRHFRMYKLRTMYADAEARKAALMAENEMRGGVLFKMKKDPRITRVGAILRKYSVDELPQLWNIVRGDMALVGPRPALPQEVRQYSPAQRERLRRRQGLTGLWQIGGRSALPFETQVKMDVELNARASLMHDLKVILRTPMAVLSGSGAW